ncbi:ankyrin repeat domain-containing protein [Orientia tsutsugamushi]|uniref:Ankyrin repeat-containing protein n=3 Tax=Orientia tsutsugamushi TaxID=784 RepID=A0A2U3RGV1_ORITS|nr:ankyrin repeat domain-containing protein [Orientia tsutsugamushi]SPR02806.1 ankyrin repeat-containing protein [Orientia tsutsugamushi]SPR12449.1 ankyrin repeat-containing protein [Orientia tsutsugamushi]
MDKTLRQQAQEYKKLYAIGAKKADLDKIQTVSTELATYLLFHAIIKDDFHLFKLLVKSGAKIDTVDAFGNLPVHYFNNNLRILKYIVKKAKNCINEQNSIGQTILHIAAKENNYKAVKYLLQSGAKKNIKDNYEDIAENLSSDYDVIVSLKQCTPIIEEIEEADVQKITQGITRSYNISKHSVDSNTRLEIEDNNTAGIALNWPLNYVKHTIFRINSNKEKHKTVKYFVDIAAKQDIKDLWNEIATNYLSSNYGMQISFKLYKSIIEKMIYAAIQQQDIINKLNIGKHDTRLAIKDNKELSFSSEVLDIGITFNKEEGKMLNLANLHTNQDTKHKYENMTKIQVYVSVIDQLEKKLLLTQDEIAIYDTAKCLIESNSRLETENMLSLRLDKSTTLLEQFLLPDESDYVQLLAQNYTNN